MPSPPSNPSQSCAVTFINRFTVHGSPEHFEQLFAGTVAFMAAQPGFIDHTLVRHLEQTDQYVNIARWQDEGSFRAALTHPDFAAHVRELRGVSASDPGLHRVVGDRP